jgi:hypothetical protein
MYNFETIAIIAAGIIFTLIALYILRLKTIIAEKIGTIEVREIQVMQYQQQNNFLSCELQDLNNKMEEMKSSEVTLFTLLPQGVEKQTLSFPLEKYYVKKLEKQCQIDGTLISRAALLRMIVTNFLDKCEIKK